MYERLLRPLVFALEAEQSHALSEAALRLPIVWKSVGNNAEIGHPKLATNVAGIHLPSPIGLAAGYDKNCRVMKSILDLGFGFVCGGTVTLGERLGNPKRRMVRLPEQEALLNSMGFPGEGVHRILPRIRRLGRRRGQILVSISGTIEDEIVECYRLVAPYVAGVELNISSPNTAGLRVFHDRGRLRNLVESIRKTRSIDVPLLVKLPPWANDYEEKRDALALIETAVSAGANGLVIANTIPVEDSRLAVGKGGLSGTPLLEHTGRMTAETVALVGRHADVVSCGGVSQPQHAWNMLAAGASAVQLYTAFVYRGPGVAAKLNRGLLKLMEREGLGSVSDISGQPPF